MKRIITVMCVLTLLLSLSACHASKPQETDPALQQQGAQVTDPTVTDPQQTDPQPTQQQTTDPEPTGPTQDTQPTDPPPTEPYVPGPEEEAMQAVFDVTTCSWYNYALNSYYETPADVDLYELFYNGFLDDTRGEATDAEAAYLNGIWDELWLHSDLIRISPDRMNEVLVTYFGITIEESNKVGLDSFAYFEETNLYYNYVTGLHNVEFQVDRVVHQDDGTICVYYHTLSPNLRVVTVKPNGDGYLILSNLPVE